MSRYRNHDMALNLLHKLGIVCARVRYMMTQSASTANLVQGSMWRTTCIPTFVSFGPLLTECQELQSSRLCLLSSSPSVVLQRKYSRSSAHNSEIQSYRRSHQDDDF